MNVQSKSYLQEQFGQFSEGFTRDFAVVETILRNRHQFFNEIREGIGVPEKTQAMMVSSTTFLAVYGAVLGSTHSLVQAFSSATKLPSTIKKAEIQMESTLSLLGTLYSQLLIGQSTNHVADYSRLSNDVDEEVCRLQDQLEALWEVKFAVIHTISPGSPAESLPGAAWYPP